MLQYYAESNSIRILPINIFRSLQNGSAYELFPDGQSLSELNLRTIVKSLSSVSRYVVDYTNGSALTFVYDGAVIKITDDEILSKHPLYVTIEMDSSSTESSNSLYDIMSFNFKEYHDELDGTDKQFKGVKFLQPNEHETNLGEFQLLDSSGNVPPNSWIRFDQKSLALHTIDGGEV